MRSEMNEFNSRLVDTSHLNQRLKTNQEEDEEEEEIEEDMSISHISIESLVLKQESRK